ncbi:MULTISPECIES: hypothetical protein [Thermomicrobium]|jgi:hypothetical protein|uniref:Uncharacterized protein n=1 Tax=Thermomicrobium roseum (strain ATCC 27502 / DSM 5159 / P-2) TaxID=309801 RepID=B9L4G3_THERP|nr:MULTISPECIES: hypothetical protein [Thermomicrobium]ACM07315.1 conserved hypothetical protein [Thermomicrobium roseum DSM 5159]MBO9306791.1 hypothetical protein [Thermomicrobium sp.]MBO9386340.1 hypothetical protein [Thermomicrobium sp.]MBO9405257.1 hypothetical protein [Thermomicrobium sp.]
MRTLIRYTILNQDGQPVIRAVRVVYPATARVAPLPQEIEQEREAGRSGEHTLRSEAAEERRPSGA